MKQTIAELGIGGEGWILYKNPNQFPCMKHITIIEDWTEDADYLMPRYVVRELLESGDAKTAQNFIVFANEIVYSTKKEAEDTFKEILSELDSLQKQFNEVTEDQKKDACAFIKKLKNIANPQQDDINWNQVRINAAISVLNALLETTQHSVTEEVIIKEFYAKAAVGYADKLVYELKRSEALFEEKLKEI